MSASQESMKYYQSPYVPEGIRYNLRENPAPRGNREVVLQQPSGTLKIASLEMNGSHLVERNGQSRFIVLIAEGKGMIQRDREEKKFDLNGNPAIFYVDKGQSLHLQGNFVGWVLELQQTPVNDLEGQLPYTAVATKSTLPITERIYSHEEIQQGSVIKDKRFPNGEGEYVDWGLGQWNSGSPLNIAYGQGGLGSEHDESHIEPGILEIHLTNYGRTFMQIDEPGGHYNIPQRAGDVTIVYPNMYCRRERYSAYSEFCVKMNVASKALINPKAKLYK